MFKFIERLFLWLPAKSRPVLSILFLLLFVAAGIIFLIFKMSNKKELDSTCSLYTIKGVIYNLNTNRIADDVIKVEIEGSTNIRDINLSNGEFVLEGVKLNNSKIVTLRITYKTGVSKLLDNIDLKNERKYLYVDCEIDIGTLYDNLKTNGLGENVEKGDSLNNPVFKTFFFEDQYGYNKILIKKISNLSSFKYGIGKKSFKIKINTTGEIVQVSGSSLFYYTGGHIAINVNDIRCHVLDDLIIERSLPAGNLKSKVLEQLQAEVSEMVDKNIETVAKKIAECLLRK